MKSRWQSGLAAWMLLAAAAFGAGPSFSLTEAEQAWLAANPEIVIGVPVDSPPLHFTGPDGRPAGLGADVLDAMNQRLGGRIRLQAGSAAELADRLDRKELDGVMDAVPGGGLDAQLVFSRPYLEVPAVIVGKRDARYYRTAEMLRGSALAVVKGSALETWFRQNHPKVRRRLYATAAEALDAVARGQAVAFAGNRAVALHLLEREMLSNLHLQGRLDEAPSALCLGVRADRPELSGMLNRLLDEVLRRRGRALRAKWFVLSSRAGGRFEPSPKARAWLEARDTIRIGVPDNAPPMAFADASGEPQGLAPDLLDLLNERLEGRIEVVPGPRAGQEAELKAGRLDALMEDTPAGGGARLHTKPYANIPNVIVGRRGDEQHVSLESLEGRTVAVAAGFPALEHLRRSRPGLRLAEYGDVREALAAVSAGQAEAFVGSRAVAAWVLARDMLSDLQIQGAAWEIDSLSAIGVRPELPELAEVLNAALASLPTETVQGLYERWGGRDWHEMTELAWIQLSPEERRWLEAHPVILVGSNPRWAPLEFTDHTGRIQGIAWEYLNRFGKALGVTFRPVSVPSWRQAQAKLRDGEVDMLTSLNKASARRVEIEFTPPYQALPTAIFTHENTPYVGRAEDLKGLKVAAVIGYGLEQSLEAGVTGLRVQTVYDVPTALKQLESGELDAFVGSLLVTGHYIQRGGHARIKVGGELDFVYQPAFAVRRDTKILAQILSKALAGLDEQEQAAIARKWMAVTYEQRIDYRKLYKYAAGTLALLGLFVYWNRRMAAEIRRRQAVEASLRKSEEALVAANKELEAFSYSVSHDLRAPLRHVAGFVQLLQANAQGKLDETGARYIEVIAGATRKMGELIDDLLSFSRTGRAQMRIEPVALGPLVDECRRELEPETKGRRIEWVIGELPEVQADRSLLRQVLANLLGNAVKYTGKREDARIEVTSRREGGEIIVCVRDNGAGFDMKYADKLFGVFQRLHNESDFEGTGIGLANVRRIVVRHGGRTWAEGAVDRGAAFSFSLPEEPAAAAAEEKS
ncbi:MAG TPA: transporter substrate-binding domain-containing protein [Kiritimatiellia bacterium]|nr:transporter substrate-binding domain-containing protein [Kiritimatiellia bacterium]